MLSQQHSGTTNIGRLKSSILSILSSIISQQHIGLGLNLQFFLFLLFLLLLRGSYSFHCDSNFPVSLENKIDYQQKISSNASPPRTHHNLEIPYSFRLTDTLDDDGIN